MVLTVPDQYPLVIAAATSTVFLNAYQYINVNRTRKASGIKYPQLYAEKAEAAASPGAFTFNCAQRAHQNTLENIPYILLMTFVSGLKFPVATAALTAAWVVGRVMYTYNYTKSGPTKRGGRLHGVALTGLLLVTTFTAGQLVYELYK